MAEVLLALTGLRQDGRKAGELRQVVCALSPRGTGGRDDGSALLDVGNTKVACGVRGPREVVAGSQTGVVVTVVITPFSTQDRRRPVEQVNKDRKAVELAQQLEAALNAVVMTSLFPRSSVHCLVHVLQGDGGVAAAAFNVAMLALMDAGVPIRDLCVACSVGVMDSTPLLDPCQSEVSGGGGTELWITAFPSSNKVLTTHFTGRVHPSVMKELVHLCLRGVVELGKILGSYVRDYVESRS